MASHHCPYEVYDGEDLLTEVDDAEHGTLMIERDVLTPDVRSRILGMARCTPTSGAIRGFACSGMPLDALAALEGSMEGLLNLRPRDLPSW